MLCKHTCTLHQSFSAAIVSILSPNKINSDDIHNSSSCRGTIVYCWQQEVTDPSADWRHLSLRQSLSIEWFWCIESSLSGILAWSIEIKMIVFESSDKWHEWSVSFSFRSFRSWMNDWLYYSLTFLYNNNFTSHHIYAEKRFERKKEKKTQTDSWLEKDIQRSVTVNHFTNEI